MTPAPASFDAYLASLSQLDKPFDPLVPTAGSEVIRAYAEHLSTLATIDRNVLAAFIAARHAGRSGEEALRTAVAAGAASTLEVGAGRFDPRQAGRLQAGVLLSQLEPLAA